MIPRLKSHPPAQPAVLAFLDALRRDGFTGDISITDADRVVLATDNSIYQVMPEAILFPRSTEDLVRTARTLALPDYAAIALRPRGGGTGTNGQSLGHGVVVDLSRHMNRILEIDVSGGWVRVEAGVVKDQLNAALLPYGLFFAPELSTSNRATIGGMISTDACGQGSCLYGKTRDHVLELSTVLDDGTLFLSRPLGDSELASLQTRADRVGEIHRVVDEIQRDHAALIAERFPKLNRCLTGYDLAHIRDGENRFNLNSILCGSEGTLAFIAEAKLRVLPIPRASALVNLRYASFDAALRDARALAGFGAASVETIDSKVLDLARADIIWPEVSPFFPDEAGAPVRGINLVEFVGDDPDAVMSAVSRLTDALGAETEHATARLGHTVATGADVERLWTMRKKAVGLLGNVAGRARPVAFVEDTVVPPERLADYIAEFRAALDRRGVEYGMFGHVDAGVLHVRPALDLKDPAQQMLIREITEEVIALTTKYGGLLWGEHGKGIRSEFVPRVFGPLYPCLVAIKRAFDPLDRFNPGKIASAQGGDLLRVDGVPFKGSFDRQIPEPARHYVDEAMHCNGNGACFNYDEDDPMCPSWKATRERRHSPKGRSALVREWLRRLAAEGVDPQAESAKLREGSSWRSFLPRLRNSLAAKRGEPDFSHEVREALDGCLACKACAGQCPIKVDVPTFRAKVFELYYGRYLRRPRDYLVGWLETFLPALGALRGLSNAMTNSRAGQAGMRALGLVATPAFSRMSLPQALAVRGIAFATPGALAALSAEERARSVVLVQDAFTRWYETGLVLDTLDLIQALGFRPWIAPFRPNGKPLHVHGFLGPFQRVAARNARMLRSLAETGVELIGLDPSMTLTYRAEYAALSGADRPPAVLLLQEWLGRHLDAIPAGRTDAEFVLLPHCTERTAASATMRDWQAAFAATGARLRILPSGCCGMAGTYGHEAEHRATSEQIYRLSWAGHVAAHAEQKRLLATGYSCRSQVKLMDGLALSHPVQALLACLRS
ncbi:D-2-hydroxyglutarate dehydrogenase YdiJ [Acidocella sp.]|jgi:FAD/FMN-containing dehydrogenase|uniref:D-2-hydroxyglutarate dehydrogenase YdiJ n=1 Tax=Acidocella sp. TaxID=50710 RepID=UPI002F3F81C5